MAAYIPSVLIDFVPASSLTVGSRIVDGEGLVYRINEVRRERGYVSFGLDRNPMLIMPPRETKRMRPGAKVRVLSPEGEAVEDGRPFSWLPGYAP